MRTNSDKMNRLTKFIKSQRLREFLIEGDLIFADLDAEILDLIFQLEVASEKLENHIKELYIKEYYYNEK